MILTQNRIKVNVTLQGKENIDILEKQKIKQSIDYWMTSPFSSRGQL